MDFRDKYKSTEDDLEKLAKNDQEDYADTMNKYPYGYNEHYRILALSDEEFEKEFGDKYRAMLEDYERNKDEAAEFQTYSYNDVWEARVKYEHFKNIRNRIKNEDEQER